MVHSSDHPACSFCSSAFGFTCSCIGSCAQGKPPLSLRKGGGGTVVPFLPWLSWGQVPCSSWVGRVSRPSQHPELAPYSPAEPSWAHDLHEASKVSMGAARRVGTLARHRDHSASPAPLLGSGPRGAWLSFKMRHHLNAECFSAQPGLVPWGHAEMFAFKNLPPVSLDAFQPECSVRLGTIIGVTLSFSAKYNV